MADRNISISPRKEETREKKEVNSVPVQFKLEEIEQHFNESLNDIRNQFKVAESLAKKDDLEMAKYVWRSQVVFAEGIMDFYMHEISKYAIVRMFTGEWEKSSGYENFMIPISDVEAGIRNPESKEEWVFDSVNNVMSQETYMGERKLKKQLSLIGIKYDAICKEAFSEKKNNQHRLKNLYARRNQIAHQADRQHTNAEKNSIDQKFAEEAIETVTAFVKAVHSAAQQLYKKETEQF